jgi:hypothetical protein
MDLEHELRALAGELTWPPTPPLRPTLAPRRRDRRPPLTVAIALAIAAVAAAFAVPQSRAAILRFLHLGGTTIQFVSTLPQAEEAPLSSNLGATVSEPDARTLLDGHLLLPLLTPQPPLHAQGQIVSLLFLNRGHEVLLSEGNTGSSVFLKKLASSATRATAVPVGRDLGVWLSGAPHVVYFPGAPPRLAGNVLIWQHGPLTLRLEGRNLTETGALELAAALR